MALTVTPEATDRITAHMDRLVHRAGQAVATRGDELNHSLAVAGLVEYVRSLDCDMRVRVLLALAVHHADSLGQTASTRCEGCVCDPVLCASDDSGEHCIDRSCGACLHGCPDPDERGCRYCRTQSPDLEGATP